MYMVISVHWHQCLMVHPLDGNMLVPSLIPNPPPPSPEDGLVIDVIDTYRLAGYSQGSYSILILQCICTIMVVIA